jgi:hypothetical protein
MDPAPDPAISVIDLQDTNKQLFFCISNKKRSSHKTVGIKVFLIIFAC